jgi:hypothetical protein
MEGAPPVANRIDLFMHFLGVSHDGLVARRVDLDTISSSVGRFIDTIIDSVLITCIHLYIGPNKYTYIIKGV